MRKHTDAIAQATATVLPGAVPPSGSGRRPRRALRDGPRRRCRRGRRRRRHGRPDGRRRPRRRRRLAPLRARAAAERRRRCGDRDRPGLRRQRDRHRVHLADGDRAGPREQQHPRRRRGRPLRDRLRRQGHCDARQDRADELRRRARHHEQGRHRVRHRRRGARSRPGPPCLPLAFASCVFTAKPLRHGEDLLREGRHRRPRPAAPTPTTACCCPAGSAGSTTRRGTCNLASVATGRRTRRAASQAEPPVELRAPCSTQYLGKTVLLPVFDSIAGNGRERQLPHRRAGPDSSCSAGVPEHERNTTGDSEPHDLARHNGLIGKFLGFTTLDEPSPWAPSNPGYATVVALTN